MSALFSNPRFMKHTTIEWIARNPTTSACRRGCFSLDFPGLRPRSPIPQLSNYVEQPLQRLGSEGSVAKGVKDARVITEPYDER